MDNPKPPDDVEQKNIIDKLANFVARNGPEFEHMTKSKQKDNPKFAFLFGGEFFNYYQYKVNSEHTGDDSMMSAVTMVSHNLHNTDGEYPNYVINQQKQQQQALQAIQPQPWQPLQPGGPPMGMLPQSGPPPPQPVIQHRPVLSQPSGIPQPVTTLSQTLVQPTVPQQPVLLVSQPVTGTLEQQISTVQQNLTQLQTSKDEQIRQSESNLAAQYQNMIQQQGPQIDLCIKNAREARLQQLSLDCDLRLEELDRSVQPIIDSCTKDGILNCKNWIMINSISNKHCDLITQYILKRVIAPESPFSVRLHLIYLMNDLLHHCMRKGHNDLKENLEKIVIPTFCTSIKDTDDKGRDKLMKLLNLWERHHYFNAETIELLKNPGPSLVSYKTNLMNDYKEQVSVLTLGVQTQYNNLQKQHHEFVGHLSSQIQQVQSQLQSLIQQKAAQIQAQAQIPVQPQIQSQTSTSMVLNGQTASPISVLTSGSDKPPVTAADTVEEAQHIPTAVSQPRRFSRFSQPHPNQQPPVAPPPHLLAHPDLSRPPPDFSRPPPDFPPQGFPPVAGGPPPGSAPGQIQQFVPDLSRPPPGFPPGPPGPGGPHGPPGSHGPSVPQGPQGLSSYHGPPSSMSGPMPPLPHDMDLTPSVPYYELPAGLMAPLVQLEETEYKSLDPCDIRLPPPMPPTERLMAAVEAFYGPPSHDRPRDTDGWEKLGLYEFFKAKQRCKKIKEEREADVKRWSRPEFKGPSKSSPQQSPRRSPPRYSPPTPRRSPPPIKRSPSPPRRRYRDGRSRSRSRERQRYSSPARDRSRSRSAERLRSPERLREKSRSPSPRRRNSQAGQAANSPLPYQPSSRSPSPVRVMKRSISRSPTPPSLGFGQQLPLPEIPLGQTNKGHQLMLKMGWSGKGLGLAEQGRIDPVEAAEVREKQDMFKGIGSSDFSDPFEQFRKNKAKGYVQRMRARDEMRDMSKKGGDSEKKKSDRGDKERDRERD